MEFLVRYAGRLTSHAQMNRPALLFRITTIAGSRLRQAVRGKGITTVSSSRSHYSMLPNTETNKKNLTITFVDTTGIKHTCPAVDGETLLDVAKTYSLEVEGACQGDCACSTCHMVLLDQKAYQLIQPPTEREEDMLDLAFNITASSRLGCQVHMSEALNGAEIKLPGLTQSK
ncbi:2Fe-2S ferredoxin-type domain-containing protein [Xylaria longipes]|nr:2Fe-2S ferredoxin-type domain-containing protein [Xylaria longipes]RYC58481.1 hypothetical protein CHU98_g7727 [Xylaria longipes]